MELINQAIKTVRVTIINTSKRKNTEREEEKKHKRICLSSSVQYWHTLEERAAPFHYNLWVTLQKIPKGCKNQSSNLILPKVLNLFSWLRDSILIVFLKVKKWWFNPNLNVCCEKNSLQTLVLLLASNPCFFSSTLYPFSSDTRSVFIEK